MQRASLLYCLIAFGLAAPAIGQDRSLADIGQELSDLSIELQTITHELSGTGNAAIGAGVGTLQRIDLIEAELQRLTLKTEQMEFIIANVVRDGTNRIGELEFRICELEPDCDIAALGEVPALGGDAAPVAAGASTASIQAEFAVGEQADFDAAVALFEEGSYQDAADRFTIFTETYTGGPLTGEAHFMRGEAHAKLGDTAGAARAYLASFSSAPNGERAADSLLRLGVSLAALGQVNEACTALGEMAARFPDTEQADTAEIELQRLGCS